MYVMAALLFARVSHSLLLRVSGIRLILTASTTFSIRIRKQTSGEMGQQKSKFVLSTAY